MLVLSACLCKGFQVVEAPIDGIHGVLIDGDLRPAHGLFQQGLLSRHPIS